MGFNGICQDKLELTLIMVFIMAFISHIMALIYK